MEKNNCKFAVADVRPDVKLAPYSALENLYAHRLLEDAHWPMDAYLGRYGCVIVDSVVYCNESDSRYHEIVTNIEDGNISTVKWLQFADATLIGTTVIKNRYGHHD